MKSIVVVLDGLGIGGAPDARDYGDEEANTFLHICEHSHVSIPTLRSLGLFDAVGKTNTEEVAYAIGREYSCAKDTVCGHWELMGCVKTEAFPVFPNGFPNVLIRKLEDAWRRKILGNEVASGTEIINQYGDEHLRTGFPIVYTSADSVLQIAADINTIPLEKLYEYCLSAREIMSAEYAVARIIARPFTHDGKRYQRTADRKDYVLPPRGITALDLFKKSDKEVVAVGKIDDIFSGRGITKSYHTKGNDEGMSVMIDLAKESFDGLLFVNLVDFDMLYGHRNDVLGYARALEHFDSALPELIACLGKEDTLIITADHGCDPTTPGTDHTREQVPILLKGHFVQPGARGIVPMASVASSVCSVHGIDNSFSGRALF